MTTTIDQAGIIPVVEEELDTFEREVQAFRSGERDEKTFMVFRLREGTYGQRQADAQMLRVKIPGGIISAAQIGALGELARQHAPLNKGHITTRENVQYHHLKLEDAAAAKRLIGRVGLTSREACGNTVRNVITCPLAGVCRDELFDVTPYLTAYVRYFVRKPFTQNMPRKFKTSFSPCARDCAVAPFHDLGFVAQIRVIDGVPRKGFRLHVGGGSSIMPRSAPVLYDFVPVEEYLRVSEAVLRVFNRSDELRKNRMMARIKVLVDRIGIDALRSLVERELQEPWAAEPVDWARHAAERHEAVPDPVSNGHLPTDADAPAEYDRWLATNAVPQRQEGYWAVTVTVPLGDLTSEQFAALAGIVRQFGNGWARLTWEQNIVIRWVRRDRLRALWDALGAIGLGEAGANEITDVTSCPGTDSCKMGITASMGLARATRQTLAAASGDDPLVRGLHIKISGCPNGCGRHHLASIGLQGASVKGDDGRQVPAYEVYIGGQYEGDGFRYAQRIAEKVPAKRAPEAIQRILAYYQQHRLPDEPFNAFVDRVGAKTLGPLIADLRPVGPLSGETLDTYIDWDRTVLYKVERGEGECSV